MKKKSLLTCTVFFLLSALFGAGLSACGGNGGKDDDGGVMEVPPTTLEIAEETIEATQNVPFQVNVCIAWENWEWNPDVMPGSNIMWTLRTETFEEPVNAYPVQTDQNESGDGWLRYYFTYEIVVDRYGEATLTATSHTNIELFDTVQITLIENQGGGDGENGGQDEYQPCAEENLELELVNDHYVVTGLGSYELGSTGMGTYYSYPNSLIIINEPNGIPITEIADNAFAGNTQITHFESSTVTKIGNGAFENCTSLQGVYLQEITGTLDIGNATFRGCENLEQILAINIKSIGEYAFANLQKLYYAGGVGLLFRYAPQATIGAHAFEGCTAFQYLDGGAEDLIVGDYAFAGCSNISSVYFNAATLGSYALSDCESITGVNLGLKTVGQYSFAGCDTLQAVTFTKKVESIEANAFESFARLSRLTFKNDVDTIHEAAFKDCKRLSSVQIDGSINSIGDEAFSGCEKLTEITLEQGATTIGARAFENCVNFEQLTSKSNIGIIGEEAFKGCKKMYNFSVTGSVDEVKTKAFLEVGTLIDTEIVDSGHPYFAYHVTEGTKIFRNYAFRSATLCELDLSKTETIEEAAFSACRGEVRTSLSSSFTTIPNQAFLQFNGLYNITFNSDITEIGEYAFSGCMLSDDTFTIPNSVTKIGAYAFDSCNLKNGNLPTSLTYIGEYAFQNNSSNKRNFTNCTVTIPESIKEIGNGAFLDCGMKKLVVENRPDIVSTSEYEQVTLGEEAFYHCKNLEEISFASLSDFGNKYLSLQKGAFDSCSALTTVDLGYVKYVGQNAFKDCSALTSFTIRPRSNEVTTGYEANSFSLTLIVGIQYHTMFSETTLSDAQKMAGYVRSGECNGCAWTAKRG